MALFCFKQISYSDVFIKQGHRSISDVEKMQEVKNQNLPTQKTGKIMFSSNCAVCGSKKSRFIKEQAAKGIADFFKYKPLRTIYNFLD